MNTHNNARLTPKGRADMVRAVVDRGLSKAAAARRFNTTPKTVAKWGARFKAEGVVGLRDRSSKPLSSPSQTPLATADAVEALRRVSQAYVAISDSGVLNRGGIGVMGSQRLELSLSEIDRLGALARTLAASVSQWSKQVGDQLKEQVRAMSDSELLALDDGGQLPGDFSMSKRRA